MAKHLVDSEPVSGVNSLIYRENAGRAREHRDPGTARWSNSCSIQVAGDDFPKADDRDLLLSPDFPLIVGHSDCLRHLVS